MRPSRVSYGVFAAVLFFLYYAAPFSLVGWDRTVNLCGDSSVPTATCELLRSFRVCGSCELKRYGEEHDGGYLICSDVVKSAVGAISLGIDGYDGFGIQLSSENRIPVYEFDCTNPTAPTCEPPCELHFEPICVEDGGTAFRPDQYRSFAELASRAPEGDLVLKLDVEGAEWGVLSRAEPEHLRRYRAIAIEFHALAVPERHQEFLAVMHKLLEDFVVVWVHGNNCCHAGEYGPYRLPTDLEVSFVRKDLATLLTCQAPVAHPLDLKNVPDKPEVPLHLPTI